MGKRKDTAWQARDLAEKYIENIREAIPLSDEQMAVMCQVIDADDHGVDTLLDLGCGDGILGAAVIEHHPGARGVFLDFSEAMIEAARRRFGGRASRHRFVIGDYATSDWVGLVAGEAPYDAIVSGFSIHHQGDERKREIYGEIFDLLSPNGVFVNVEHVSSPSKWIESRFADRFIDDLHESVKRKESPMCLATKSHGLIITGMTSRPISSRPSKTSVHGSGPLVSRMSTAISSYLNLRFSEEEGVKAY